MRRLVWLIVVVAAATGCRSGSATVTSTFDTTTPSTSPDDHVGAGSNAKDTIFGMWEVIELNGEASTELFRATFSVVPDMNTAVNTDEPGPVPPYYLIGDGCNSSGGTYEADGHRLTLNGGLSTLVSCPHTSQRSAFQRLWGGTDWSVDDGLLTLTGDSGTTGVLRQVNTNPAIGVWLLAELDGRPPVSEISMDVVEAGWVEGYAGCFFGGDYQVEGNQLTVKMRRPASPHPPPELLCENVSDEEHRFLTLLSDGRGLASGDELRFTSAAGTTAVFHRA